MKKNFKMLAALAVAVAATSCSNDDLMTGVENNAQNNGAIGVNTFIANGTRGVAYDNVDDFRNDDGNFDLYAWEKLADDNYEENPFMSDVKFVVADNGGWDYENKGEVRFWLELGEGSTVDFYAVSPADLEDNQIGSDEQKIYFSVAGESANQVDLMYAKAEGVDPEDETTNVKKNGVKLDFHHALSQIVFKAKVHEDYMNYVSAEVESVKIVNLYGTGIFDFANAANGVYSEDTKVNNSWSYQDMDGNEQSANASYAAEFTDPVTVNADYTSEDEQPLTDKNTALLLLPQDINGATIEDNKELPTEGTYFAVTCKVWYQRTTTDGDGNETTEDILIVGNKETNESITLYYPLTTSWYEGWKYTYTFVFSANTADPITIDETSTVDAWWPGEDNENNTDVPETGEQEPEKSEDELTQAELNARLIANQFATANAATITADGVTFIENESWPTVESEVNHSNYFSYKTLSENGLLTTAVSDENGNYWRVPTADEWNMLVIKDEVYSEVLGETFNYTWTTNMTHKRGEETVIIDGQETTTSLTIGPAINVNAITRGISIEEQSIGALRFKGTKQHAAYLYSPMTLNESIYALEIRIKALKSDEEVEFQDICNAEYWNDEDCIKIVLPALQYSNGTGFSSFYTDDKAAWYLTSTSTEVQGLGTTPMVHYFNATEGLFGSLQASSFNTVNFPVRLIKCDAEGNLVLE